MVEQRPDGRDLALQFLGVRRAIGGIGLALPLILLMGGRLVFDLGQQPTISDYHGTPMRDVFVGLLCAIGVFLLAYRGYGAQDLYLSQFAGLFAVAVAFFPNTGATSTVHFTAAALFFLTLALISFFLFTRSSHEKGQRPPAKRRRNAVYRVCGVGILVCVLLIATHRWWTAGFEVLVDRAGLVFWLESAAVWFFAVSWIVKGETLRAPFMRTVFRPFVDPKDRTPSHS